MTTRVLQLYWIFWAVICLILIFAILIARRVARKRKEARRHKRLRMPRNSLQKYPSFVASKITGVITILPPDEYKVRSYPMMGQTYLIAVGPPVEFHMSSLSYYDRLYPGRAIRQEEPIDIPSHDSNNNVIFHNNDDEDENNNTITDLSKSP